METAVVGLRWVQYAASFVLAGGALFALYALPARGPSSAAALAWPRRVLAGSAAVLFLATVLGLLTQTAVVAGAPSAALDPTALASVLTDMAMGPSSVARGLCAALALGLLVIMRPAAPAWVATAGLGGVATASLAWMGHGAATEGAGSRVHLAADIAHLAAAAVWIGAIVFFLILAQRADRTDKDRLSAFHAALAGFSGVGSALVAVLVATGLINSGFLVGMAGLPGLFTTLYGRLLLLKLLVFGAMLALAAANRFRLTPALRGALDDPDRAAGAVVALRKSLALEAGAALAVLALAAWLGRLAPLSSL